MNEVEEVEEAEEVKEKRATCTGNWWIDFASRRRRSEKEVKT